MKLPLMFIAILALEISVADARYEYNERSELTRVMWNDEVMFGYEYDQIGNLKWACVGCKTNVYEVNSLNQYTTITDSDGNVHQLTYDEDGNLVQDFRRVYLWDSASRLMVCRPLPGRGGFAVRNHYDALGRRVKKETTFVAPFGTYPHERAICTTTYVYDGILPVLEEIKNDEGTVGRTEYVWGKDLSGALDGAGGVGGLLYVKIDGAIYIPLYEAGGTMNQVMNKFVVCLLILLSGLVLQADWQFDVREHTMTGPSGEPVKWGWAMQAKEKPSGTLRIGGAGMPIEKIPGSTDWRHAFRNLGKVDRVIIGSEAGPCFKPNAYVG